MALRGEVIPTWENSEVPEEQICPLKCSVLISRKKRLSYCASLLLFKTYRACTAWAVVAMEISPCGYWGGAPFKNTVKLESTTESQECGNKCEEMHYYVRDHPQSFLYITIKFFVYIPFFIYLWVFASTKALNKLQQNDSLTAGFLFNGSGSIGN